MTQPGLTLSGRVDGISAEYEIALLAGNLFSRMVCVMNTEALGSEDPAH